MSRTAAVLLLTTAVALPAAARAQDIPESSPEAVAHHAKGLEHYVKEQYREAIPHFYKAFEVDPTFYVALFMAAVTHGNAGEGAKADSLYALIAPHRHRLSPYYQHRLDAQVAGRAGDPEGYIEANRKAVAVGSGTKAAYNLAQGLVPRNRAAEAREALRTLDPDREPMRGWYSYYSVYANAAHALGDFEDELQMARRGRRALPDDIRLAGLEAEALAALGRLDELERVLADVEAMPARGGTTPGTVMTSVAQELAAHGRPDVARRTYERAVAWLDARPAAEATTQGHRGARAYALYSLGQYRQAAPLYEALATEFPANAAYKAWGGYLAALTGDRKRAADVSQRLQGGDIRMNAANTALWRGLIAAALKERDTAVALLRESDIHARWMHRDPVLLRTVASAPSWVAYLKPER